MIPKLGRLRTFVLGVWLLGVGMILFAFIGFIDLKSLFVITAIVIRLIEGMGSALILAAGTSMLSSSFPNNLSRIMSLYSASLGLGYLLGPILGALFHAIGGYYGPFIAVGLLDLTLLSIRCTTLPLAP